MTLRIANAAGFLGDDITAPRRLVDSAEIDFLTLEYLAELTMSILAHQKAKNPAAGFAQDVLTVTKGLAEVMQKQTRLKVITNAGGVNPRACTISVARILVAAGLGDERVAVVSGDCLTNQLGKLQQAGHELAHMDNGKPLSELGTRPVAANAYLGARPIVEALDQGARMVITGRVADASLTVAPAIHRFGWQWDDWQRLEPATVAGHLIECGAQVTGGYSDRWREIDLIDIGYPIAEIDEEANVVITKPNGSGGIVDARSVAEQLVYEIGDPARYLTPDVVADFTGVELTQIGMDRVSVSGAQGTPAPDSYKVSITYPAGYMSTAQLVVWGNDCVERARFVGQLILKRLASTGVTFDRSHVECLGAGDAVPLSPSGSAFVSDRPVVRSPRECVVRVTVQDSNRGSVERFTEAIAPLITNGPSGLAGYAAGRPTVRPVLAYWPALISKSAIHSSVEVRTARQWCDETMA